MSETQDDNLRHQHELLARLVETSPFGVFVVDAQFRVSLVGAGARAVFAGIDPVIGRDFTEIQRIIWPEPFASDATAHFRHTLATGEPYYAPDTTERRANVDAVESYDWKVERLTLPDGSYGVVCHFYDATRLRQVEQALQRSEQRYRALTTATSEVAFGMSADWSVLYPLDGRRLVATNTEPIHDWMTKNIPPDERARVRAAHADATARKGLFELEHRVFGPDGSITWTLSRAVPILDEAGNITEWFGVAADITHRKRDEALRRATEARQAFFLKLSDAVRPLSDPAAVQDAAMRVLGEHLGAGRAYYCDVDADEYVLVEQYTARLSPMAPGRYPTADFGEQVIADYRAGRTVVMSDTQNDPRLPPDVRATWAGIGCSGVIGVPLVKDGQLVTVLGIHTAEPREWTTDEVTLVEQTAERTWAAVERARAEASLRGARDAAEAANASKDRFLATLSHELRTPLTPVAMAVAAMEANPELPAAVRDELAMIGRNVALEVKLIDDLLDLSRVVNGKLLLRREPVELNDVVRDACHTTHSLAMEKGVRLDCDLGENVGAVDADAARLQQVLWNLIRNAAKFTPQGGRIIVTTARTGDTVRATVADTGMGIASDDLVRVFDAFEQSDAAVTREFGGMGLGLAISKSIVELHGGTIRADSAGPGRGATFTVALPALSATASVGSGLRKGNGDGPHDARTDRGALRVLLVEDHVDTARLLVRLLGQSGHAVRAAHTAAEALAMAACEPFDLVVSDIGLPDSTGYDLMAQLRSRHGLVGIAMSGYGMDKDVRHSQEAGFVDHLLKPVNFDDLERTLRRVAAATAGRR